MKDDSPHSGFIKALSYSLKQFRLYSDKHPITRRALESLGSEIDKFFQMSDRVNVGTMRKRLIVDGVAVNEKETAAHDLAGELDRLSIEGIVFERGINLNEVSSFMGLMATRTKALEEKGGFKKVFEQNSFPHIKLSSGKFKLVKEGQVVTEEDQQGDGKGPREKTAAEKPKAVATIGDVIERLRSEKEMSAPGPREEIGLDCEKIVVQLEKNPQEIAQMALQDAKDPARLEVMIRRVVRFLVDGLISFLIEQGKDITKALERLAKELEKALSRAGLGDEFDKLQKKVPEIFEEAADELRIQMLVRTREAHPNDPKPLEKMAQKLFKDEEIRDRLGREAQQGLLRAGMSSRDIEGLFDKIEEKKDRKKRKVSIDAGELEALRRRAESFDEELQHAVVEKVEKVEKEKRKILAEKERVDTVIRNLAEGLLVVDKHGKVVLMNPAAEKLLGMKRDEKVGKSVAEGLKDEHMVAMTSGGELKDSEDHVTKQVEVISIKDETRRVLQASTAVIENEDGETVGMVSVLSDVTRQKELDGLKSKFVANVSHELRTPLVAIQKSLALILGKEVGEVNPEQRRFLNIAQRNIERLSRLINDLLDVSKLEAGKLTLKPKRVPARELVMHVISTVETWMKDKHIKLETKFSEEGLQFEADPDRLTQVITNLMGNAIKFTPDSGTITVEVLKVNDPEIDRGPSLELAVRDTGIGIAAEDREKIFDKFVQVSLAQPAGVSSTGLGLTIAKEIIQLHSGKIWVESEEGKGSRFAFCLPLRFKLREEIKGA